MRIGLYGGAFNPVHNGHMAVARAALQAAKLDRLIFIPSGNAPHKAETHISRDDRFNMLSLAIKDEIKMEISDYELKRFHTAPIQPNISNRFIKRTSCFL